MGTLGGRGSEDRARHVIELATSLHMSLGTAESCTGGLVAAALTSVPGSSEACYGGIVSYALSVKHGVLGVESSILDDPSVGAVSSACAAQMAEGARHVLGCDLAVSVTGIAGPGGAELGKPVGTVWFAVTSLQGTRCDLMHFEGDRAAVRAQATDHALALLEDELMEHL
jgi:nicotinamide-nucleotide amidase